MVQTLRWLVSLYTVQTRDKGCSSAKGEGAPQYSDWGFIILLFKKIAFSVTETWPSTAKLLLFKIWHQDIVSDYIFWAAQYIKCCNIQECKKKSPWQRVDCRYTIEDTKIFDHSDFYWLKADLDFRFRDANNWTVMVILWEWKWKRRGKKN